MIRSCTLLPLFCILFSTSVVAKSRGTAFAPRKTVSRVSSTSSSLSPPSPPPLSALDTSAFSSERDAQIVAAYTSLLASATALCRGGYQGDDYYDDRGYGGNNDDYYDNYGYDDRGSSYDDRGDSERSSRFGRPSFSNLPDIIRTGNRKIGLPLLAIGGALTILGASLFFNKTLMRLGNLFFVAGVPMTLGPGRTAGYFFQPKKARATGCLFAGIFLVFIGWPIFGIILEVFGLLNLFGNMFPMAMMILKNMPVIGPLLKGNAGGKKKQSSGNNDRYSGGRDRYDDYDKYQDEPYDGGGDNYYGGSYYQDDKNDRYSGY